MTTHRAAAAAAAGTSSAVEIGVLTALEPIS